jgi:hypothetical protein
MGLHAMAIIRVIARQLRFGCRLEAVELRKNRARIDLVFRTPSDARRIHEVKSSRELREIHRLQAALYWQADVDEVVLSNGQMDIMLSQDYIDSVQVQAKRVQQLIVDHPDIAATTYKPNAETCPTCANQSCPFHANRRQVHALQERRPSLAC